MASRSGTLTVYFEDPFWVGVFERNEGEQLSAAKVTFGAEPKDREIYDFILHHYDELEFSPAVPVQLKPAKKCGAKRLSRDAQKAMRADGIGTKAQQALKLQQEQRKQGRKARSKEDKRLLQEQRFQLKQMKRRRKHKGH